MHEVMIDLVGFGITIVFCCFLFAGVVVWFDVFLHKKDKKEIENG